MSNIDLLLDTSMFGEGEYVLTVDEPTRTLQCSQEVIIGVEGDNQADKIYFVFPTVVGDGISLSSASTQIYIKFKNALGETYYIESGDHGITDDGSYTFSWLVTQAVTPMKGSIEFSVWVVTDETLPRKWNTTPFPGKVLKGLDVEGLAPEVISDQTVSTYQLVQEVQELQNRLTNVNSYVNSIVGDIVASEVTDQVDTKFDSLEMTVNSLSDDLGLTQTDLNTTKTNVNNMNGTNLFINSNKTKTIKTYIDDATTATNTLIGNNNKFKLLSRHTFDAETNKQDYKLNLSSYMTLYNELMIIVSVTNSNNVLEYRIGDSTGTPILSGELATGTHRSKISMNKTDDAYMAWSIDGNDIGWTSQASYSYFLYKPKSGTFGTATDSLTVVVYGR